MNRQCAVRRGTGIRHNLKSAFAAPFTRISRNFSVCRIILRFHRRIRHIIQMFLKCKGFRIRHKKTLTSGPRETKCVTGVRIGKFSNDVPRTYIDSVYREIKRLKSEKTVCNEQKSSLKGKFNHVKQFNMKQAVRLEDFFESVVTSD